MASEGMPNLAALSLRERVAAYVRSRQAQEGQEHDRKKPSNLIYDVDETPPIIVQLGLSIQHIFMMSIGWLYVSVIAGASGATHGQATSMIRMSMLASGLATILQASRTAAGSGYLVPLSGSLTYLQPSILAARSGGFSLLFGMVAFAGALSGLISRVVSRLRVLFPPEVTGLMISMSGLQLVALGCPRFVGLAGADGAPGLRPVLVGVATLLAMLSATVWLRGKLQVMPMLLGMIVGFASALPLGVLPWGE
jgi:xanthine permease XanP